jgi:tetratricopeptide (TPR) repeat protein
VERRWFRWGVIGLVVLTLAVGAAHGLHAQWLDQQVRRASQEFAEGRFQAARDRLRHVARSLPADERIAYELGLCEFRLGNADAALAAWGRIAPGTEAAARAAVVRAEVLIARGRYADAEAILISALETTRKGPDAAMMRERLVVLCRTEGRVNEIRPVIERVWAEATKAALDSRWDGVSRPQDLLRQYAAVDLEPFASEGLRQTLAEAERREPGDDRVQLGLANLAIREGRYDEAERRLRGCEARRPVDPAVAQAWLDWAMATGNVAQARAALGRLPDDWLDPASALALRAWFAGRRADTDGERHALEQLAEYEPGRPSVLERLAELTLRGGDETRVRKLRAQKAEIDSITDRYKAAYFRADAPIHSAELAGLAEALGRRFEARAWWTILAATRPDDPKWRENLIRLARAKAAPVGAKLSDLRADLARPTSGAGEIAGVFTSIPDEIHFVDDAEAVGLRFVFDNGQTPERQLPETMGGGVGLLDYDGDGWIDVYAVQGGRLIPDESRPATGDRLFRNRGDGTFDDVTETAGLPRTNPSYGHGVSVGDYDNDGDPDLFVTRLNAYQLFRNRGDGTFEDVTEPAGLGGAHDWPTSAAFVDVDADGDLDLYVCHYALWDVRRPRICHGPNGSPSYCPPRDVVAAQDRLFRNDHGRFVDITADSAVNGEAGRGLGVVAADLDGDGRIDVFVANDGSANYYYRSLGGGKLEEVGHESGLAASAEGGYQAGMGIACGDLDGDGRFDLAVTNFFGESTTLFQNFGHGLFVDRSAAWGVAAATRHVLGFGTSFLDANNDGHLDLLTVNGHVVDRRPEFPHEMPAQVLAGNGRGRLVDVSAGAGEIFGVRRLGRGLAVGDLDNDGRIDAVSVAQNRPLVYFHNRSRGGHWVRFKLEGTSSNRDGVGAVVTVQTGGRKSSAVRFGGGSYMSASDPRLHFGLGAVECVDVVEVAWPSGRVDRFKNLTVDVDYRLREAASFPVPLARRHAETPLPTKEVP